MFPVRFYDIDNFSQMIEYPAFFYVRLLKAKNLGEQYPCFQIAHGLLFVFLIFSSSLIKGFPFKSIPFL